MKVLIACEFSGVVRDAFERLGHDAWSCDLLPATGKHIQCDVLDILNQGWDLMIAHPPCTYLSAAGLHLCNSSLSRRHRRDCAILFVKELYACQIPKIAIENPVGVLSSAWMKPHQIIYMNDFGHPEARKPTCLWLKGLPPLVPTNKVPHRKAATGKRVSEWYAKTRDPKLRSITFSGVAEAMAHQWSEL